MAKWTLFNRVAIVHSNGPYLRFVATVNLRRDASLHCQSWQARLRSHRAHNQQDGWEGVQVRQSLQSSFNVCVLNSTNDCKWMHAIVRVQAGSVSTNVVSTFDEASERWYRAAGANEAFEHVLQSNLSFERECAMAMESRWEARSS